MGKINECLYTIVDPSVCTIDEAGEHYFNQNVLGLHEQFSDDYEAYETKQMQIRNRLIREAINAHPDRKYPKLDSVIFGASSTKNKVVLVVDI